MFSSKCRLFHNATLFGFCITHILITGCAKIWNKIRRQKVNTWFVVHVSERWHCCWTFKILLLLHHVLQLHCLKGLAFSTISFHTTRCWMHFVQLFIFIILMSPFISFSHLNFGLPDNHVGIDFHSYNFWPPCYLSFAVLDLTASIFGPLCN